MRIEKLKNPSCSCNFAHGATIKTKSGHFLGATCDPEKAERIIRKYFKSEFFPEPVNVFFGGEIGQDGTWGYTFTLEGGNKK